MLCLSPHLLIAAARSLVGTGFVTSAPGPAPCAAGGSRPSWDFTFIQHCGHLSHRDPISGESSWPIPAGLARDELVTFGEVRSILHATPAAGDIFLQYGPSRKAYVHVGIVMALLRSGQYCPKTPYHDLYTVEGDTGRYGQLHGGLTLRVRRRLNPATGDCFLRWVELDACAHQITASLSLPAPSNTRAA